MGTPGRYQWVRAYALDAAITVALDRDDRERAGALVATPASPAVRCDMRELVVRAHLHRCRLGGRTALAPARFPGSPAKPAGSTRLDGILKVPR
ncbi:hypothetical protein [Streptosporangium sp. H16]|uniref:hypothetical protein n=1 Tax=Streptosporangium sp. H16 TaxID=3444184 RepID=UPI003F78BD3C